MAKAKILVVEDDDSTREALVDALEAHGYEVSGAASAEAGLQLLRAGHYQLVATDFSMPGSTGTAMLERAGDLGLLEGCKALLITAHQPASPFNVEVFAKPLDLSKFLIRVAELVSPGTKVQLQVPPPPPLPAACYLDCDLLQNLDSQARGELVSRLEELADRGASLHAWSSQGAAVARDRVGALGLSGVIKVFLPKPSLVISMTPTARWNLVEHSPEALPELEALLVKG